MDAEEHLQIRSSNRRGDGAATRAQLLEAAGRVIAEKGCDRATGKEIAELAGTNSGAINYYFGGMDGLHAEVLVEAHRSLASYDDIAEVAHRGVSASEKLRAFIALAVSAATQPRSRSWALRVLSREFFAPSPAGRALKDRELLPKKRLIRSIVAEVMGRPEDDWLVERCCFTVIAPILMILVCERENRKEVFPWIGDDSASAEAVVAHLHAYAMGGIGAVAQADPAFGAAQTVT